MFLSRKKRIRSYLDSIGKEQWSPFESLLAHWLSGQLLDTFAGYGMTSLRCHIDFMDDYKCINVDGKFRSYYIDLQIEQKQFSLGCDPDEPDEHKVFSLSSPEYLYSVVKTEIDALNEHPNGKFR